MLLIAETPKENAMLDGVSALLGDLGIPIIAYRTDEAFALTLWSATELSHIYAERYDLTHEDAVILLEDLEPFLQATTATAGARFLDRALVQSHRPFYNKSLTLDEDELDSI